MLLLLVNTMLLVASADAKVRMLYFIELCYYTFYHMFYAIWCIFLYTILYIVYNFTSAAFYIWVVWNIYFWLIASVYLSVSLANPAWRLTTLDNYDYLWIQEGEVFHLDLLWKEKYNIAYFKLKLDTSKRQCFAFATVRYQGWMQANCFGGCCIMLPEKSDPQEFSSKSQIQEILTLLLLLLLSQKRTFENESMQTFRNFSWDII